MGGTEHSDLCRLTGLVKLRERLRRTPVLLFLDDLEAGQAARLLDISELGPGSIVIATSRLRDVLEADFQPVVLVQTLSRAASKSLFMYHAERSRLGGTLKPDVGSASITEAVDICSGLPLSLRVRNLDS